MSEKIIPEFGEASVNDLSLSPVTSICGTISALSSW